MIQHRIDKKSHPCVQGWLEILRVEHRSAQSSTMCYENSPNAMLALCILLYFTSEPFFVAFAGETNFKAPSASCAIKIIPCDIIPFNSRGSRLTKMQTC